jgi:hypothetical protein
MLDSSDLISHAFIEAMTVISSPESSPLKSAPLASSNVKELKTPEKSSSPEQLKTPKKYQNIAPKPGPLTSSPTVPKISVPGRMSRRRKILKRTARRIAPKGLVIQSRVSPMKKAAKKAVQRSIAIKSPSKTFRPLIPRLPKPVKEIEVQEEEEVDSSTSASVKPPKTDQKRLGRVKGENPESMADMLQPNLLTADPQVTIPILCLSSRMVPLIYNKLVFAA